jgi:hypothetical protein
VGKRTEKQRALLLSYTNQLCIRCTGDEGRPFGVGFQEQASNPSKLLRSRAVGSERWSQSAEAYLGQVGKGE